MKVNSHQNGEQLVLPALGINVRCEALERFRPESTANIPAGDFHQIRFVSDGAWVIYTILLLHANWETGECYPSITTIAEISGKHKTSVIRAIRELQSVGMVEITRRQSDFGDRDNNLYRLPGVVALARLRGSASATTGSSVGAQGVVVPTLPKRNHKNETKETIAPKSLTFQRLIERWNEIPGLRRCLKATPDRQKHFLARSRDPDWCQSLDAALSALAASAFCTGSNDRHWQADIDWFLRPGTVTKVLEGKYTDGNPSAAAATNSPYHDDPEQQRRLVAAAGNGAATR